MGTDGGSDIGKRHLQRLQQDDGFAQRLAAGCSRLGGEWSVNRLRQSILDEEALAQLMMRLLGALPPAEWGILFALPTPPVLGDGKKTLGMIVKARNFGRDVLREQAQRRVENVPVASVVVMGHTHLTDDYPLEHGHYLNPGSWTRYLDIETHPNLRLDELKDETQYPYELNCVVVECADDGAAVSARLECFERSA